jgi:arginase
MFRILSAPSVLGLRPSGVQHLPERLLELGLAERLQAEVAARLVPPGYDPTLDPETGTLNAQALASFSPVLADAMSEILDSGDFPLILGGDCSILLGSMLALRRRGRYGLLFLDGYADFYQPEANPNGEAASMELALVTGRGPRLLTELEGFSALVRDEDVVAFGFRDGEEQHEHGSQPLAPEILALDLRAVRDLGAREAVHRALVHLRRPELDGFFVHLDADVLDDAVMPAVDYRIPGGLSREELTTVLSAALPEAVGLEVTIYNPLLDEDGRAGRALVEVLASSLERA